MKEISPEEIDDSPQYFLPHHAILRPESSTTKLRTVFDASCKSQSGVSLNDVLLAGPTIQNTLIALVMRFRMHAYVISADIEKMYRQIWVHYTDQPLQRIYWRDDKESPLKIFQLQTVTYGTNSAPFLATRVLQQLAEDEAENYPLAAPVVRTSFYMDDLLFGCNNIDTLKSTCTQIVAMLHSAGFTLRKFSSNSQNVLEIFHEQLRETRTLLDLDADQTVKTLGLLWEPSTDVLSYKIPTWSPVSRYTKRIIVSQMSSLFDPLGLLSPVIVLAKMIVQTLWKQDYPWDYCLPPTVQQMWLDYQQHIAFLKDLRIPRFISSLNSFDNIELHGFRDASERAYGACIYMRSIAENGSCVVHLIAAKSRIAPLEVKSIARLELCAALLLSHLLQMVMESIGQHNNIILWTDSTIVLHWLAATPSTWQTFVANRVAEIQRLTSCAIWRHVPSAENPADLISRGVQAYGIVENSLWWNGPIWLSNTNQRWPENIILSYPQTDKILEARSITNDEIHGATLSLVRVAQQEYFHRELEALAKGNPVSRSSRLRYLNPKLQDGLIRVGGRLQHADIPYDTKHPLVLPDKHPLSLQIATSAHERSLHGGPQLLLSIVQHEFWPLGGRNLARKVVHNCVICAKAKPRSIEQLMGQLPPARISQAHPFKFVGIDYAGPIYLKPNTRKGAPVKAYVAVFVCLVVKAAHLELVSDLSSAAFIAALRRFVARRGIPSTIYCDNATNFTAAQRELRDLRRLFLSQQHKQAVYMEAAALKIEFHFIPPHAPTFGGLWEACVKSFKHHMRRIVGNNHLSAESFTTVLAQIEACLNSRPITPLSSDPNDLQALTPGHFLIGRPLLAVPEPNLDEIPENRLDNWQKIQRITQHFWKRWHEE
ncbi:uncharacterized protein LOC129779211 [Toxorhynchites rutilus septentrionalis]|uniref:uncharacterized protein LOC129779211 n=1 Tax=Toxorhynchites rutilus septentrionalis TaxID=329112 RepID=UPI0024799CD4|nr:uncharacterized protein LOC129779211 [Toxorhynchites rutilus septentrionalis]